MSDEKLPITDDRPRLIDQAAKQARLHQNLEALQSHLPPLEKQFSRFLHQPFIGRLSELAARTICRPSGLLGGGLTSFIGSTAYFATARIVGFDYNYMAFVGFFLVGFLLGITGEFAAEQLRRWQAR